MVRPKFKNVKGEMDDVELDPKNIMVITTEKDLKVNEKMGYVMENIKGGENLFARATAEGVRITQTDLVSYLVTGRPKFEVTAATQQAFEFVVPTAGAYVSRVLRDQLGGVIDHRRRVIPRVVTRGR